MVYLGQEDFFAGGIGEEKGGVGVGLSVERKELPLAGSWGLCHRKVFRFKGFRGRDPQKDLWEECDPV